jgi:hypothetical protein
MRLAFAAALAATVVPAAAARAFPVTIAAGAYAGSWVIDGRDTGPGSKTIDLAPGTHVFDDGYTIDRSGFLFDVDAGGNVANISNPAAAQASGATLAIANATITIDAGIYPYPYDPFAGVYSTLSGTSPLVVIPALRYAIDDGTFLAGNGGASSFTYDVDASGGVSCATTAATCSGSIIHLQSASIPIDPGNYTLPYLLTATRSATYTGVHAFTLLAGLEYGVDDGSQIGGSEIAFVPNADGTVTSLQPASATGGASLRLVTVPIHIDAGGYPGTYHLGAVDGLAGNRDVPMIVGLVTVLDFDPFNAAFLMPSATAISPSSANYTFNGVTYTFRFSLVSGYTPAGNNISISVPPVTLIFTTVTQAGSAAVTVTGTGPPPPEGFRLGAPPTHYDITTTALYSGPITVCIDYSGVRYQNTSQLQLLHLVTGTWVSVPTTIDQATQTVCGQVTSLSPFLVVQRALPVAIEIGLGAPPKLINLRSHATVAAAVLGSATFAVGRIDVTTVTVAGAPAGRSAVRDVNGDGRPDLVLQANASAMQLAPGDAQGAIEGNTRDGLYFRGTAPIRVQ